MTSAGMLRAVRIAIIVLSCALAVVATLFAWLDRDTPTPTALSLGSKAMDISYPIALLTLVALGQLIATREPQHLVAWCFLLLGFGAEVAVFVQNYGVHGTLVAPGAVPAADVALWLAAWVWVIPTTFLVIVFLVFPTGRPPTPRWWAVAWVSVAGTVALVVAGMLAPTWEVAYAGALSPLIGSDAENALELIGSTLSGASVVLAMGSLVARYRRAGGDERQQLKWFAYPSGITAAAFVGSTAFYSNADVGPLLGGLSAFGVLLIPAGAAVAILRYRLYDIDLVIERTLVYGGLSAAVGATYWVFVILLQGALRPLTGGSEIAVAGSTLATLALVQPLRARIQTAVDRRFYRGRYDAARAVDAFSVRLRDEVALEAVRGDLLDVVYETVEPAHASVWLRRAGP